MAGTTTEEPAHGPPSPSRRKFLKTVPVAAAGAVGLGGQRAGLSPVGEARALACGGACIGAIAAGLTATGWLLRDHEVLGSDDPPDGMTPDALHLRVFESSQTRHSTNASTFVDNQNLVDQGFENTLYSEGKIAAIEAINDQASESEVLDAAMSAVAEHASTVKENFLKSWNESVLELESLYSPVDSHADLNRSDVWFPGNGDWSSFEWNSDQTTEYTLPDGTTFETEDIRNTTNVSGDTSYNVWNPREVVDDGSDGTNAVDPPQQIVATNPTDGDPVTYLVQSEWNDIWTAIDTAQTDVEDGLSTWVSNVYGQVQSGDIDVGELLSTTELAGIAAEDEETPRAIHDLMALNVAVDVDREAEVYLPESDTTLYGVLGVTGERTVTTGTTIDPSAEDQDFYLTYDASEVNGTWSDYQDGIDGGEVTFTSEPHPVLYQIETSDGETVEVNGEDFSSDGSGNWTVDISDQVDQAITSVESVSFYAPEDSEEDTQNVTVQLDEPFVVESYTNTESGETYDETTHEPPSEPQADDNYITQEQWEERESQIQELIDQYEEEQGGGGGGIGLPDLGFGGIGSALGGLLTIGVVVWGIATVSGE